MAASTARVVVGLALFALACAPRETSARPLATNVPVPLSAEDPSIRLALGEVSTNVTRDGIDLVALLRAVSSDELRRVDLKGVRKPSSIVSVALVRLETLSVVGGTSSACTVSVVVRDRQGGAVLALLEGRARAEEGAARVREAEQHALRGAVRGAFARVAEAMK